MTGRATVLLLLAGLLVTVPAAAGAQEAAAREGPVAEPPGTGGWGAVDIAARAGDPTVSITVVFPHGSAADPDDAPGASWLLGRIVRAMVLESLDPAARAATEIATDVHRSRIAFRLVTLPRYWQEAWGVLEWAILRASPTATATSRAKAEMREVFEFERDAPHREFEIELYWMLGDRDPAWSRDPRGEARTVDALGPADLAAFRDVVLVRGDGVVSIVGGVDPEVAARTVTDGPVLPEGGLAAPGFTLLPDREGGPDDWDDRERVVATREVTSTWIGVAWPIDPSTSRTAREMLVDRLDRQFNSDPPDPGAFSVEVRLDPMGAHELLVVEAAVVPDAAGQWERRIVSAVDPIAAAEMDGPFFRAYRRQFRGSRLLGNAPPEVESLRRAMDLLFLGRVRDLPRAIDILTPGDLQEAAENLEEPRIFVFGPDLGGSGSP